MTIDVSNLQQMGPRETPHWTDTAARVHALLQEMSDKEVALALGKSEFSIAHFKPIAELLIRRPDLIAEFTKPANQWITFQLMRSLTFKTDATVQDCLIYCLLRATQPINPLDFDDLRKMVSRTVV